MTINNETVIASNRFGFGAKPGDLQRIGSRPRDWLRNQVDQPDLASLDQRSLASSREALQSFIDLRARRRDARRSNAREASDVKAVMKMGQVLRPMYMEHAMARGSQAVASRTPFYERLLHFWSNHFAVSIDDPQMLGLVGTLELEAIRPHINGSFSEMLIAVEQHPAMLTFLDNFQSIGPNSTMARVAARRFNKREMGINENLAREILELHTLGVNGGYTQEDVTTFASVISGWTFGGMFPERADRGAPGEFAFNELMHEPGDKTVLNRTYRQKGIRQGEAVLKDLARHPATARHISEKLARHFISDEPSKNAIDTLSRVFLQSKGYLPALYDALIELDETWRDVHSKYKSPVDYVYSLFRTLDYTPDNPQHLVGALTVLGQAPFRAGSPAGWPDSAAAWSGGEALFKRVELAVSVANKAGNRVDPLGLARLIFGPSLGEHSRLAISRAESARQGLAMLFASPEFQRR